MAGDKIVFLDIDGVIITAKTYALSRRGGGASPECVAALNHITDATGAGIVVSSNWRLLGTERLRASFAKWAITGELLDVTPDLSQRTANGVWVSAQRGSEILSWVRANEPDNYVILDDDSFDMDAVAPHLVETSMETGLTMEDAHRAVQMLTRR